MKYRLRWPFYFDPPLTGLVRTLMATGLALILGGSLMAVVLILGG